MRDVQKKEKKMICMGKCVKKLFKKNVLKQEKIMYLK